MLSIFFFISHFWLVKNVQGQRTKKVYDSFQIAITPSQNSEINFNIVGVFSNIIRIISLHQFSPKYL